MTDTRLEAIYEAINNADTVEAKRLLVPLLKGDPGADAYYYAALVAGNEKQTRAFLRRALAEDSFHTGANRLLMRIEKQGIAAVETEKPDPPTGHKPTVSEPTPLTREAMQQKQQRIRRNPQRRRILIVFGIGAFMLSLSMSWLVMLLLGIGGVFINPVVETLGGDDPITEYNGTPIADIPNPAEILDLPAAISTELPLGTANATGDVMRSGLLHEYSFRARGGGNIALAVQFFSPFAQNVFPNVAIIDPNDELAGERCRREIIIDDSTGAAFICAIDVSGNWRVRIFGQDGESSGAYVVTAEGIID